MENVEGVEGVKKGITPRTKNNIKFWLKVVVAIVVLILICLPGVYWKMGKNFEDVFVLVDKGKEPVLFDVDHSMLLYVIRANSKEKEKSIKQVYIKVQSGDDLQKLAKEAKKVAKNEPSANWAQVMESGKWTRDLKVYKMGAEYEFIDFSPFDNFGIGTHNWNTIDFKSGQRLYQID